MLVAISRKQKWALTSVSAFVVIAVGSALFPVRGLADPSTEAALRIVARVEQVQPPVWLDRMGIKAAVKPGWALYAGDKLITAKNARLQLSFADEARLNLGGDAELRLNPLGVSGERAKGSRSLVLDLSRGTFRYAAPAFAGTPSSRPLIRLGGTIEATVLNGEVWASADSQRNQLGLIQGVAEARVADGEPSTLDQPGSVLSVVRGAQSKPAAPLGKDQLAWWLSQSEFVRGQPVLSANGAWAVALLAGTGLEAVREIACQVQNRGYPAEIFMRPAPGKTWHRLVLRRLDSEADARSFVKAAGSMKFKDPLILTPTQTAALGEAVIACPQALPQNEMWIAKVPPLPVAAVEPVRPPIATEGILVRRFVVEGARPHSHEGVTPESVQAVADQAFSRLAGGQSAAALTPAEMQQAADEVKTHYRSHGFLVAIAYVPAQTVGTDGTVKIQVLEGRVADVVVDGATHYSAATLRRPAQSLVGAAPTQDSVESAVLYAQDYPGVRLSGVLRPGIQAGDTQLVLRVSDEDRFAFTFGGDNYGTENSGEYRLQLGAAWNSPTGLGDRLDLSLLQSVAPEDTTSGSVLYQFPMGVPGFSLNAGASRNAFKVSEGPFQSLQLEGTINAYHGGAQWRFKRSRLLNANAGLTYTKKDSELMALGTFPFTDDQLDIVSLTIGGDLLDTEFRGVDEGSVGIRQAVGGNYQPATGSARKPDFTIFDARYARLQALTETQTMLLSIRGQHTSDSLSVLEQFPMAGPQGVRAYPVGDFLRDTGRFASLEYRINAPGFAAAPSPLGRTWGEVLQFKLFADYAYGEQAEPLPGSGSKARAELSGAGLGIQIGVPDGFRFLLQGANRLSGPPPSDGDDFRLYGEFTVPF